jgi:transposase
MGQRWTGGTGAALSLGPNRRAVEAGRAAAAGGEHRWQAGEAPAPCGRGRDPLRGAHRLFVAATTDGLPTLANGLLVLQPLGAGQTHRADAAGAAGTTARAAGRNAEPSAGIIDSQSVKGADTVGRDSRGYDAAKRINGRKRFIITDTLGLLIVVVVLAASVQDRDGAKTTLLSMYAAVPVRFVFADGGFAGRLVEWAKAILRTTLHIVRKPEGQQGFVLIPRRWPVERTFAWLTGHRRLARDYERDPAVSEAMIRWAAINTMVRRIVRGKPAARAPRGTIEYVT